ncbi:MAG TPA: TonB-dependent receptor, partial [Rhodanobacteraceae bacterium]
FNVPLLKDAPAAKALDLDVAGRRSQYNIFGGIDSSLAALQWTVNDQLAFRASWSRDFNAPDVTQLFSASVAGSADVADPCSNYSAAGGNPTVAANCRAAGVPANYRQIANAVLTTSGRNPNLKPETSTSRTLAASWQPVQDLPLTLNADYFKIGIRNAISGSVPQDLLDGCYISGAANLCDLVTRNGTGAITSLDTGNINLGGLRTEGLDFGVDYSLATDRFGTFGFNWMTTWMKLFTETQPNFSDPAQPIVTRLAHRETGHTGYPTIKSLLTATWTYHRWQAMWQIQYFNALVEPCSDKYDGTPLSFTNLGLCSNPDFTNNHLSTNKLGAVAFSNVQARYRFAAHGPTLIFGINNIFNRVPPISHAAGGYDKTLYPIPGRFPYISVAYAF